MTLFHKENIACPYCLNEEEITIWDEIDAVEDPDLKEKLLKKKLQVFDCRNCGRTHLLASSMLFKDEHNKIMIWCDPKLESQTDQAKLPGLLNSFNAPESYKLRLTTSNNQMIEKIHLDDHNLDDRIMEVVKLAVLEWQQEEIKISELYFLSASAERLLFLALGEDKNWYQLPVSAELYNQIEARIGDRFAEDRGWQKIDKSFGIEYFKLFK